MCNVFFLYDYNVTKPAVLLSHYPTADSCTYTLYTITNTTHPLPSHVTFQLTEAEVCGNGGKGAGGVEEVVGCVCEWERRSVWCVCVLMRVGGCQWGKPALG